MDELISTGVGKKHIYEDHVAGQKDDRPGLEFCLKALRKEDTLVVWKLDLLVRNLTHLVNMIDLNNRGVALKVLRGQGASIDKTAASAN